MCASFRAIGGSAHERKRHGFLFVFRLPFKRFWFTDATHVSLENPAQILEKIFFTPKDFGEGILYSLRT